MKRIAKFVSRITIALVAFCVFSFVGATPSWAANSSVTGVSLGSGFVAYTTETIDQQAVYNEALTRVIYWRQDALDDTSVLWNGKTMKAYLTSIGMTEAEYLNPQWSNSLEKIALQRAVEAWNFDDGHTRPNGEECWTATLGTTGSYEEILAWGRRTMTLAIDQWAGEKSDYVNNTGGVTGHYTCLIDPDNTYYGFAKATSYRYGTAFAGEASSSVDAAGTSPTNLKGTYTFEVALSDTKLSSGSTWTSGDASIPYGTTTTLALKLACDGGSHYDVKGTWSSSATSVATVNSNGVVTGAGVGSATITLTSGAKTFTKDISVTKATPTYVAPSGLSAAFGQKLSDVTLPANWSWDAPSTSVGSVGTHTFKATYTPTDTTNYNTVSGIDVSVTVGAASLTKSMFSVDTSAATYTGSAIVGRVSSATLSENSDYTVAYSNNTNAGTATITVTGKGNYTGTLTWNFTINKATPSYSTPTGLTATYGQKLSDVTLPANWSWDAPSTSVGGLGTNTFKATYTPADTANYNSVSGVDVSVTVSPAAIDKSMFSVDTSAATYTGSAITNRVSSDVLKENSDYKVTYSNNVNAGTATITVTGRFHYTGTLTWNFTINKATPSYSTPTGLTATYGQKLSDVTLPSGFAWADATQLVGTPGTRTFKATYMPADTANYNSVSGIDVSVAVSAATLTKAMFTVDTSDAAYTGSAITGRVSSATLKENSDYTVAYANNIEIGTATITVTGKGNCSGELTWTFNIVKATPAYVLPTGLTATYGQNLSDVTLPSGFVWADSSTSVGNAGTHTFKATYTPSDTTHYKVVENIAVSVKVGPAALIGANLTVDTKPVTYTGKRITKDISSSVYNLATDCDISYANNTNAGTATITIKGKGNYTGSFSWNFTINKAIPSYTVPTNLSVAVGKKLSAVSLPSGFSWENPNTSYGKEGTYTTTLSYKPADTANYNSVSGISVKVSVTKAVASVTMWRLYNPYSGEHLYTLSTSEYNSLGAIGWKQEGVAWKSPEKSNTPVYRLYNPYSGDHHYTTSKKEYEDLGKIGWKQEGIGFYSDDDEGIAVYRLFNPYVTVGTHHYTKDANEYNSLGKIGWNKENIAWYGLKS